MITGWNDEENKSTACGTACGANKPEEPATPSACGTACGAGDKPEGTACGASN